MAARFGVSVRTVTRLEALGLLRPTEEPRQGRSSLFRAEDARAALAAYRGSRTPAAPDDLRLEDLYTMALDARSNRHELERLWVADRTWRPLWLLFVAAVERLSAGWPDDAARVLGALDRGAGPWLDSPLPPRPRPRVLLRWTADEFRALAALPRSEWPWRGGTDEDASRRAALKLADHAVERGGPVVLIEGDGCPFVQVGENRFSNGVPSGGGFQEFGLDPDRRGGIPLVEPWLAAVGALVMGPEFEALVRAFADPEPEPEPERPATVEAARQMWIRERTEYRRARVAVRRGHRRRDDVEDLVVRAMGQHRSAWWAEFRSAAWDACGDAAAARRLAEEHRSRALRALREVGER